MKQTEIIKRSSEPTKLDINDYLTVCKVGSDIDKPESIKYYIQLSKDSDNPKWELLGVLDDYAVLTLINLLK